MAYLHCPEIVHGTFSPDEVIDSKSERKIVLALPAALLAEMRLTVVFWAVKFLAVVGLSAEKDVVVAMEQFCLSHDPEDVIKDLLTIYVISVPQTKVIQRGKGFLLQVQTQILIPYLIHFLK